MLNSLDITSQATQNANDTNQDTALARFKHILAFLTTKDEEIPIYVAGSGNYGHQRTSIAVLRRLMVLGGTKFRLVYENSSKPQDVPATEKLMKLIPGLTLNAINDTTGYTYTYVQCSAKLLFTPIGEMYKLNNAAYMMGFTGGYDNPDAGICEHLLAYFSTVLQPYAYNKYHAINAIFTRYAIRTPAKLPEKIDLPPEFLNEVGFYIEPPAAPTTFVDEPQSTEVDWKRQILTKVIANLDTKAIDLCPVYFSQGRTKALPPTVLFNLVTGILNAKSRSNTGLTINQRPTVILIMSRFQKEIYQIMDYLLRGQAKDWDENSTEDSYKFTKAVVPLLKKTTWDYISQAGIRAKFPEVRIVSQYYPNADPSFQSALNNASPGGIVIVDLQNIPNSDFEYVFSRGTLPAVFEGEGSASLMLNLGKPFFHLTACDSNDYSIYPENVTLGDKATISRCRTFFDNFTDAAWDALGSKPDTEIGQFIVDAYTPSHDLAKYFQKIGVFFHNPANDKVHRAVPVLLKYLKTSQPKAKKTSTLATYEWKDLS
jgi:hypothetical protein